MFLLRIVLRNSLLLQKHAEVLSLQMTTWLLLLKLRSLQVTIKDKKKCKIICRAMRFF
jgi:hypothetical protein